MYTQISQAQPPKLPERIARLDELAHNLWWSWYPPARSMFRALDYSLWRMTTHNPVKQLHRVSPERLQAVAKEPGFLALYDSVIAAFDAVKSRKGAWYAEKYPDRLPGPIAFFSAEFALHASLPIYAGGLGILAGDFFKEASDLGVPMIGVGLMYPQGYFQQRISADGWQEEIYRQLDFYGEAPLVPVPARHGKTLAKVQVAGRSVSLSAWQVNVGSTTIYLLDTNVEENTPQDRRLAERLYIADRDLRVEQETVLGIGGVRALRALGIEPAVWHINEGHAAFSTLERIKEKLDKGIGFGEAVQQVRATTVFTTHTPVPAGHDVFPTETMEKYFRDYWTSMDIGRETFLEMGRHSGDTRAFNMTVQALKTADRRNAVSQLHGQVTRRTWGVLWPGVPEDKVPISHVTNGVHVPTWVAPEMARLYSEYIGADWLMKHDDPAIWERVKRIPDDKLWDARQAMKRKLVHIILERCQERWAEGKTSAEQVLALGALLDQDVLTIGFVRRFAEYKRPALILQDIERLKRIIKNDWRPVQIVFAGKSHPADLPSKFLLHQAFATASERQYRGRIAFVEDYDMHLAHYLVQGVDVWLNTPRRLWEACGTSGMKASINGAPHLSVLDGWWQEAYNGSNGWAIDGGVQNGGPQDQDTADAESLYRLLEEQVVPLYYDRDRTGVPRGWIRLVKEVIRTIVPQFCTRRMLKEYVDRIYLAAPK